MSASPKPANDGLETGGGGSRNTEQIPAGSVTDFLSFTNSLLAILIIYVLYKLFGSKKREEEEEGERFVPPPPLPKHDMTLEELRKYDGKGPDKRICIAILGRVYDCSRGYSFYGPGGSYSTFAGRDASRALAKFDVMAVREEWDDLSDLGAHEMSMVTEWGEQFQEKYDYVGRLVRCAEEILEKPDFEEELPNTAKTTACDRQKQNEEQQQQQHGNGGRSATDSEVEIINDETSSSSNGDAIDGAQHIGNSGAGKKVSFNLGQQQQSNEQSKRSSESDDIEVIE